MKTKTCESSHAPFLPIPPWAELMLWDLVVLLLALAIVLLLDGPELNYKFSTKCEAPLAASGRKAERLLFIAWTGRRVSDSHAGTSYQKSSRTAVATGSHAIRPCDHCESESNTNIHAQTPHRHYYYYC